MVRAWPTCGGLAEGGAAGAQVPLVAMTGLGVALGVVTLFATKGPLPTPGFAVVVASGLVVALLIAATPLVVLNSASGYSEIRR
ncbi:hypothetical protein ABZ345_10905 [Lentzea sp. NPDC005914]|uniref:hypothetical protein n=1 Tax=Lentzea sp. NPDC005914 TaxID=3154572 RepID=UPI0033DA3C34